MPSATDNIRTMPAAPMLCASTHSLTQRCGAGRRLLASITSGFCLAAVCASPLMGCAKPLAKPALTLPSQDTSAETLPNAVADEQATQIPAPSFDAAAEAASLADPAPNFDVGTPEVFAAAMQDPQAPAPDAATAAGAVADTAGYRTVGAVLAEVNGKPIFSEEVIEAVRNDLRGRAKQQPDKAAFLLDAQNVLAREVKTRIDSEMLRLVAERNLTREDRQRATFLATQFRINLITEAGGSEARAREIALRNDQVTLEKLVEDMENLFLFELFRYAIVMPRAEPSADEVRDYFRRHPEEFSARGKGEIEFLLIEINGAAADAAAPATPEQMQARAQNVLSLAQAGEDFAALASKYNENPAYKASGGAIPGMPLGRGDFRWPAVDTAVWNTPEGQVTPIISDDDGRRLFIAKVIRRVEPKSIGFDAAQSGISEHIRNQRRQELIGQYLSEARQYAAVTPSPQIVRNLETALEVVEQQYDSWRAE